MNNVMNITYRMYPNSRSSTAACVYLNGKIVGDIKRVAGGYQYVPAGQDKPNGIKGEVFESFNECWEDVSGERPDTERVEQREEKARTFGEIRREAGHDEAPDLSHYGRKGKKPE